VDQELGWISITCYVLDMQEHSNVVLDDTWLNETAAVMDYGSIQCTVVRIGHKCVLLRNSIYPCKKLSPPSPRPRSQHQLLSETVFKARFKVFHGAT